MSSGTRLDFALKTVDYLFFSLVPGFLFLGAAGTVLYEAMAQVQLMNQLLAFCVGMIGILYLGAMVFWVFLGKTVLNPQKEVEQKVQRKKNLQQLFVDALSLGASIAVFFIMTPQSSYLESLRAAGTVFYLAIFAADMLDALGKELRSMRSRYATAGFSALKGNLGLLVMLLVLYLSPTIFVAYKLIFNSGHIQTSVIVAASSFILILARRLSWYTGATYE